MGSKYASDKNGKYPVNFKYTYVTHYYAKRREHLNLVPNFDFFYKECKRVNILDPSANRARGRWWKPVQEPLN